ncbi:hypothetical protein [Sulfurospirillum sp. MES]|uniref:ORC-CDC6 family AAA ATPase n=1 Tax=Sulfurospirillum sp. MES TaxID=1565314 RepID=UPI000544364F|nr:hypothetical protein [Sulfurospirillum sp. MES]KHG33181.1 MAG: hypothetical protein OA34_11425 [Sulfurospirillum sp. MES]
MKHNNFDSTIFDSLNARHLTSSQIAKLFIPPEAFFDLLKRNNNLLIGPRGSGKTTLLKMLQLTALKEWKHSKAEQTKKSIDYISAFIPTDKAWETQWSLIDSLCASSTLKVQLKKSIFTTHTIRQMVEAFQYCTSDELFEDPILKKFYINLSKEQEIELTKRLASALSLTIEIPSLDYIMFQLRKRLSDIGVFLNKNRNCALADTLNNDADLSKYVFFDFIPTIALVIEVLNSTFVDKNQKWALLFDELEIAPREIRNELFENLRSTGDQRIIFKLSISPYAEDLNLSEPTGSYAGHDYVPINLTYAKKEKAMPFCLALFQQICRIYKIDHMSPEEIFGTSIFDQGNENKKNTTIPAYSKDSLQYERFSRLANKDPSFNYYLKAKNIDIENMDKMPENERASKVRKITNIVCIRDIFLQEKGHIRTIKKTKIYTGFKTIFYLTEGNPRLFLSLVGTLLKKYSQTKKMVTASEQADAIDIAIDRFLALLKTIPPVPGHTLANSNKDCSLINLLDIIGTTFQNSVLKEKFVAEPITSFIIDDMVSEEVKTLLGLAVNAGVIIYVHQAEETPLLDSLANKEFRLNYLLAPYFRLPMILNKKQKLSVILGGDFIHKNDINDEQKTIQSTLKQDLKKGHQTQNTLKNNVKKIQTTLKFE